MKKNLGKTYRGKSTGGGCNNPYPLRCIRVKMDVFRISNFKHSFGVWFRVRFMVRFSFTFNHTQGFHCRSFDRLLLRVPTSLL